MPILVSCDQCGRDYKMKTKLAGTRFRCKNCENVIRVPYPKTAGTDDETADEARSLDDLSWAPVPPVGGVLGTPLYKSGSIATRVAASVRKRKWRNKSKPRFPWKKFIVVVSVLAVGILLVKFGLDYAKTRNSNRANQQQAFPSKVTR